MFSLFKIGRPDRTRTDTPLLEADFKSAACFQFRHRSKMTTIIKEQVQEIELHYQSSAYEADELLLLHPAIL